MRARRRDCRTIGPFSKLNSTKENQNAPLRDDPDLDGTNYSSYSFVGPFATDTHACIWARQHKHDTWHILDLNDPGVEPLVLTPSVWVIKGGRVYNSFPPPAAGEPGAYILYVDEKSYCLFGPFEDIEQCQKIHRYHNLDDDPRWYALLLNEHPRVPWIEPAPPIPDELLQQHIAKRAEREALLERLEALR